MGGGVLPTLRVSRGDWIGSEGIGKLKKNPWINGDKKSFNKSVVVRVVSNKKTNSWINVDI